MSRLAPRGQATPITVVILVAVTILLALGVFLLFQGEASQLTQRITLNTIILNTASSLRVTFASTQSDLSTAPSIYCFVVTFTNVGGGPMTYYVTVLPLNKIGTSYFTDNLSAVYPVKVGAVTLEDGLNLRPYILADIDGNGLVNLVGSDPNNPAVLVSLTELMPPCRTIYSDSNLWNSYVRPSIVVPASRIMIVEGFSLKDLYDGLGAQYYPEIPLWRIELGPGESYTMLFVIALDDPNNPGAILELTSGHLVVAANVAGEYYFALTLGLPGRVG
jgi:hypothetical protein